MFRKSFIAFGMLTISFLPTISNAATALIRGNINFSLGYLQTSNFKVSNVHYINANNKLATTYSKQSPALPVSNQAVNLGQGPIQGSYPGFGSNSLDNSIESLDASSTILNGAVGIASSTKNNYTNSLSIDSYAGTVFLYNALTAVSMSGVWSFNISEKTPLLLNVTTLTSLIIRQSGYGYGMGQVEYWGMFGYGTGPNDPNAVIMEEWQYTTSSTNFIDEQNISRTIVSKYVPMQSPSATYFIANTVKSGARVVAPEPQSVFSLLILLCSAFAPKFINHKSIRT